MTLGQIFQSISAWQKLAAINMNAGVAYKILKYMKLVTDEHAIVEKQRVALIHEITGTKDGEDAKIEPDTYMFGEYVTNFNAVLAIESDLKSLDVDFMRVVNVLDEKDESLSVQDLAMLEPFFLSSVIGCNDVDDIEEAAGPITQQWPKLI